MFGYLAGARNVAYLFESFNVIGLLYLLSSKCKRYIIKVAIHDISQKTKMFENHKRYIVKESYYTSQIAKHKTKGTS